MALRLETRIARIMASDASDEFKAVQLDTLALRCFASSPNQLMVKALSDTIKERRGGHRAVYAAVYGAPIAA